MKATMFPIARIWLKSIGFAIPWTILACPLIAEEAVDFGKQIMPILQKNCVACHHLKEPEGGLVLESHEALMKGGDSGKFVTAGKSAESKLIDLVSGKKEPLMPPADNTVGAKKLTAAEIALLSRWIDEGAKPGSIATKTNVSWSKISSDLQPIYTVASSEDGQFAAVGKGNLVTIYQWPAVLGPTQSTPLIDPSVQATLGKDAPPASHLDLVQSMTFNPDGDLLVTGGYREIKFWRRQISPLATDQIVAHGKGALIVANPDGKAIAVAKEETAIEIWDTLSGKKKWSLKGHIGTVESMAWSASSQELAVADSSGRIAIWGIRADGEGEVSILSAITQQGTKKLSQLQWLDPNTIVGVTNEAKLEAWKISRPSGENATASISQSPFLPESADIRSIGVLTGSPSRLVIASKDGTIKVAKLPGGEIESTWQHGSPIQLIATATDGKTVASLGVAGETKIWAVGTPKPVAETNGDYRTQRLLASMNKNFSRQKFG